MRPDIPRPGRSAELRHALPVVVVAVLLVVGSLGLGAAVAPVAADAHGGTLVRTVDDATLAPGESTTVTVEINASERGNFTVVEALSPGFASVELVDDDGADFSGVRDANDKLFATYGDRENVTLQYRVTAADSANATTHELTGYGDFGLEDTRATTTGDGEISVSTDGGSSVIRSVDDATLAPGESATVWVAVDRDRAANFTLVEEFSPAFGSVEIVDADGADFSGVRDANDELFATYGERELATLVYEVTADNDATAGTVYEFDGFADANGSQSATGGSGEISVQASDGDSGAVRSVDDESLAPGESTTVRVEVDRDEATNFTIIEEFNPAFASVELVDDDGADFSGVRDANDELFATYGDRENVTLVYEVTAGDDAGAATAYQFDGFTDVNGSELTTGGTDELDVQSGSDDGWDLTRSADDTTLEPGESTVVSVEITGNETTNFTLVEEFNPGFASVELVDDDGADFSGVRNANDELFATYGDRENVTLQYRVTAGEDVDEDASYQLDGFAQFDADGTEMDVDGVESLTVGSDGVAGGGGGGGGGDDDDDDDDGSGDDDDTDDGSSDTPESTDSPDDGDDEDTDDDNGDDGGDDSSDGDDSDDDSDDDDDGSDDDSGDGAPETATPETDTSVTTTTDTPVPGFGVSVALVALVLGSVFLARRRTN
ncbi:MULTISPECIES: PGF-CTERM sorting domain-containing protein [unclassified Haloferax]|uniref:PGF-CTERM sorting domain-containing protein n=1 Tax=unclassified Haloferax TaxID=2625095 RepID=UPI002876D60F|nr:MULTISPECIES: PGF-CTERM sorting domain-containing protein [unclassified Haloferax]MDS0241747.1 PGF-CTERM sorting domain-containing protein [Haloferax sp. S2CR25]MDS0444868.1 PGF-CTERM sorting domain-containing protein [Haloferax sp. S2CR25-2]